MKDIANATSSITFQSIPSAPLPSMPNSFGFNPASAPEVHLVLCLVTIFFESPSALEQVGIATRAFIDAVDAIAKNEAADHAFRYLNYAAGWQDVLRSYGASQHNYLRSASRKYDPTGVFQRQVGGFKL
jgi:hypothetical protein